MILDIIRALIPISSKSMPPGYIIYRLQAAVSLDPVNIEVKISVDSERVASLPDAPTITS